MSEFQRFRKIKLTIEYYTERTFRNAVIHHLLAQDWCKSIEQHREEER
jgi:hypothetical protein